MTALDASQLLATTVVRLSETRAACDAWRLLALAALDSASELRRQLEMVDERQRLCRYRLEEQRELEAA